uniref:Cystinosin, lysosomal cystine transporter n=1 Tax=Eptatretus burgeri TaxID=7764 RepID=A0A8C4R3Q7_EPTBU
MLPLHLLSLLIALGLNSSIADDGAVKVVAPSQVIVAINSSVNVTLSTSGPLAKKAIILFNVTSSTYNGTLLRLPDKVEILPGPAPIITFQVVGVKVGQLHIHLVSNSQELISVSDVVIRFHVIHSNALYYVNQAIGWIYFIAWSISFYPQLIENFWRKSVVGLNFDFLMLNLTGFLAYSCYNAGMYWITAVQVEYNKHFPDGVNPVNVNDVVFSLHALVLTIAIIIQCCCLERGQQRTSWLGRIITLALWALVLIFLPITIANFITWFDYLTFFSWIKLVVTIIKYIPQAYMNYRRQSTVGWSIGNVLLDFTGGLFSLLQMFLQSFNNDEWNLIFGDFAKFGLGLISILFDILFFVQHYCLYRQMGYMQLPSTKEQDKPARQSSESSLTSSTDISLPSNVSSNGGATGSSSGSWYCAKYG